MTIQNIEKEMDLRIINFPDKVFKEYLVANFDKDGDGEISLTEALSIKAIDCPQKGIKSIAGIEFFSNLESLRCSKNEIERIDVSHNRQLKYLQCSDNFSLSELDVQNNPMLTLLYCRACNLKRLNCSLNKELRELSCGFNPIKEINLYLNPKIEYLYVRRCELEELELRHLKNLEFLNCSENNIQELRLYECKRLTHLDCSYNDLINDLYVGDNINLKSLSCGGNKNLASVTISLGQHIEKIQSGIKPMTSEYRQHLEFKAYQEEKDYEECSASYEDEQAYYEGWSREDVDSGLADAYENDWDATWNNN